jgi:hypothetical protein
VGREQFFYGIDGGYDDCLSDADLNLGSSLGVEDLPSEKLFAYFYNNEVALFHHFTSQNQWAYTGKEPSLVMMFLSNDMAGQAGRISPMGTWILLSPPPKGNGCKIVLRLNKESVLEFPVNVNGNRLPETNRHTIPSILEFHMTSHTMMQ